MAPPCLPQNLPVGREFPVVPPAGRRTITPARRSGPVPIAKIGSPAGLVQPRGGPPAPSKGAASPAAAVAWRRMRPATVPGDVAATPDSGARPPSCPPDHRVNVSPRTAPRTVQAIGKWLITGVWGLFEGSCQKNEKKGIFFLTVVTDGYNLRPRCPGDGCKA